VKLATSIPLCFHEVVLNVVKASGNYMCHLLEYKKQLRFVHTVYLFAAARNCHNKQQLFVHTVYLFAARNCHNKQQLFP
jgi:hypothetical protein